MAEPGARTTWFGARTTGPVPEGGAGPVAYRIASPLARRTGFVF
ncbi:hypothetical protein OG413_02305 [Streptomyces sp. NBC_01433]|nr:hypothetical protein [Streptomyces sp. NBC_01433]MCX4674158.1 hypothetical protein [Streptomyces sp. NBC_01433]